MPQAVAQFEKVWRRRWITDKKNKCYIYTRVSTSMQVDGYSLDIQKEKLKKYAEFQDMVIADEYSEMKK